MFKQFTCFFYSHLCEVSSRRDSEAPLKHSGEVKCRQSRLLGKILQADIVR